MRYNTRAIVSLLAMPALRADETGLRIDRKGQPRIVSSDHPRSSRIHASNAETSSARRCRGASGSSSMSMWRSQRTAWPTNR